MRFARLFPLLILLTACGSEEPSGGAADANQIARLSTPEVEESDPDAAIRLQPVDPGEAGLPASEGCVFTAAGQILLVAEAGGGSVRLMDEARHLVASAPVGPTGGFFEDRHLSISVGRRDEGVDRPAEAGGIEAARITVTNRRTGRELTRDGNWICG